MKIPARTDQRRGGNNSALRFEFSEGQKRRNKFENSDWSNSTAPPSIEHRSTGRIFFDRLFDRVITKFRKSEQSSKETRERYFSARQDPRAEWEVY